MRLRRTILFIVGLLAAILLYSFLPGEPAVPLPSGTKLAVWMGVTWSMDAHTAAEINALAADLNAQQVDYAYVYVSYLRPNDTFNATYDHAAEFTRRLREAAPNVALFAWVGVPITTDASDNRLTDSAVRQHIADFAAITITEMGFDGFHQVACGPGIDQFGHFGLAIRRRGDQGIPLGKPAEAVQQHRGTEDQREQDVGNAPFMDKLLLGDNHGDKTEEKDDEEAGDVLLEIEFQVDTGDVGGDKGNEEE